MTSSFSLHFLTFFSKVIRVASDYQTLRENSPTNNNFISLFHLLENSPGQYVSSQDVGEGFLVGGQPGQGGRQNLGHHHQAGCGLYVPYLVKGCIGLCKNSEGTIGPQALN